MIRQGPVKRYSPEEIKQYERERAERLLQKREEELQRENIINTLTVPTHRKPRRGGKYPIPGCHKAGYSPKEENKFPNFREFQARRSRYDSSRGMDPSKCRHGFLPKDCGACKELAETVQARRARLIQAIRKTREKNAKKKREELEKERKIREYWDSQPPPTVVENKSEKAAVNLLNTLLPKMPDRSKKGARARLIKEMLEKLGIEGLSPEDLLKMAHERMTMADTHQDLRFWEEAIQIIQSENSPDSDTIDEREQDRAFHILNKIAGRKSSPIELSDPKKVKNVLRRGKKIVEEAQRELWADKQRERRHRRRAISVAEGSMDPIYNRHHGNVFAVSKTRLSSDDQEARNYKEHVGGLEVELGKKQEAESDQADDINISPPSAAELGTEWDELGAIKPEDDPESDLSPAADSGNGGEDGKDDKPLRAKRIKREPPSFDSDERNVFLSKLRKRQRFIDRLCGENATGIIILIIKNPKVKKKQISQTLDMPLRTVKYRLSIIREKWKEISRIANLGTDAELEPNSSESIIQAYQ
jgi:hypothetical protein